jgi:sugar phosphate permease
VLACFLATFTAYVERVGFSIAFTAMAKQAGVSEAVKGTVLSAFFWGYAVSQARHAPLHSASPWGSLGGIQAVLVPCRLHIASLAAWWCGRLPGVNVAAPESPRSG